ncbi:unnamed protein product [Pleuronectes platessa]|uniref:Uncharacterized protein n=1 Tax=Pleuronectes platessa TaxID=8262 RepID=A0A9N7UX04_PLEPL|nr:unnamed protein product [Pleuronectes platessa]
MSKRHLRQVCERHGVRSVERDVSLGGCLWSYPQNGETTDDAEERITGANTQGQDGNVERLLHRGRAPTGAQLQQVFNTRTCQLIRQSFPVCPEHCSNREVSLGEAAAVDGMTALLKSETLVPVNSNQALRLPLSHSGAEFPWIMGEQGDGGWSKSGGEE